MKIEEFNKKLASYINDVRLIEKSDPDKARKMWLKIAEFALEFSKQPGIDRTFKLKLWNQVNVIIKKVKETSLQNSAGPADFQSNKTSSMDPAQLPSVPMDDEEEESNQDLNSENKQQTFDTPNFTPEEKKEARNDFFERIMKMENEMKQIPDFWKEIKAQPYTPDKSIIPFSNPTPPDDIGPEDPEKVVHVKKATQSIITQKDLKSENDFVDPYRGTKDFEKPKDPFGPTNLDILNNENVTQYCPLCGAKIKEGINSCPNCGSSLK